jgi:O-antigen/teichoic acid export membrane protein
MAVQVLMNAVNVPLLGIMNFAVSEARRRLVESGYNAWRAFLWRIGLLLVGFAVAFGVGTTIFAKPLLALIYTPAYVTFASLMPIFAIQLVFAACNTVLSAAFRTAEKPQVGFAAKAAAAVVTLVIAYPLLNGWGVTGAAVGLVVTQVLWTIVYVCYVLRGALRRQVTAVGIR